MVTLLPEKLKDLWDEWNLRAAVLFSLSLQIFLIFSATLRKRVGPGILMILIWLAYLLADWIAAFAVGLISNGQTNGCADDSGVNKNLAAFWAPFLLLHLGGPDTITAFALEDNELWIRHLFGLLIQLLAVIYVFLQSLPNDLWFPIVLVLVAGATKYAERTRSLYVACLGNFRSSLLPKPDAGPNYAQLMEEYSSKEAAQVPVEIDLVTETENDFPTSDIESFQKERLRDSELVQNAFELYKTFRGLIVEHMLSFQERDQSRKFFFQRTVEDAFKVMEVELNFIYDELYTKTAVVHKAFWYVVRIICSILVVIPLQQFGSHNKYKIQPIDLAITYTLLVGALVLDFIGNFKLIFSDWTIAKLMKRMDGTAISSALLKIVSAVREKFSFDRKWRWSNTISKHSLIFYCVNQRAKLFEKVIDTFGLKALLDERRFKMSEPLPESVKNFVFDVIQSRAEKATEIKTAKEIYSARGEVALSEYPCHYPHELIAASVGKKVDFDESVLLWHIATELCYYTSEDVCIGGNDGPKALCKLFSEYMLYLLIMRPTMMSSVAGIAHIMFQDTCEEAKKFFSRRRMRSRRAELPALERIKLYFTKFVASSKDVHSDFEIARQKACADLLSVKTVAKPAAVKGDRSKSVLFDACMLAKELKQVEESKRWEMMSKVWVELVCYAASHCRASSHAQQLSKGGEFLTFVWLLMAHFGLGEQFRIQAGHVRAKLIVGK